MAMKQTKNYDLYPSLPPPIFETINMGLVGLQLKMRVIGKKT